MHYYVGIDISQNHFTICIINQQAKPLLIKEFPQSAEGYQDLLATLQNYSPATILLESSGRYHLTLTAFLLSNNLPTFIVNPKFTHQFHKFIHATSPTKSDTKDASLLALFALKNPELLHLASIPDNAKIISRTIQSLSQEIAKTKTQILQTLQVLFPELITKLNPFSKTLLSILIKFPSAPLIKKAQPYQIEAIIYEVTSSRGKKPSFSTTDLKALAKNSIGIRHPGYEHTLKSLIRKLFFLEEEIAQLETALEEEINKVVSSQEKELLSYIKGLSKKMVNRFLAEIENIKRFSSAKKLIKYAGLDPVVKQSGKWISYQGVSKRGSSHLRNILYQMAQGLVTWNEVFRAYYRRKKEQYGSHRKAMIAVVNKMVRVLYAILSRGEPFREELVGSSSRSRKVSLEVTYA